MANTNNSVGGSDSSVMHKHHNVLVMVVFILVALLVAILLMFLIGWLDFTIPDSGLRKPTSSFQQEVDKMSVDELQSEFMELEASINSL